MDPELSRAFHVLRASSRLHVACAAAALRVPEARLFAAHPSRDRVRLAPRWDALLEGLQGLGPLVFHTDGRLGVHRLETHLHDIRTNDRSAFLSGQAAELRLLLSRWHTAWAVMHDEEGFAEVGLHIYDHHGDPVLRVLQTLRTDRRAFQQLVARHRMARQDTPLSLRRRPSPPGPTALRLDLRRVLLGAWPHLSGGRGLAALLRRHGLRRPDAYALVSPVFARPVDTGLVERLLEGMAGEGVPAAIHIGNRASIQAHRGEVERVGRAGRWITVQDPSVFLHLDTAAIDTAWVVRRPERGGTHTVVELLSAAGDLLGGLRSLRRTDELECPRWRSLVERLVPAHDGTR